MKKANNKGSITLVLIAIVCVVILLIVGISMGKELKAKKDVAKMIAEEQTKDSVLDSEDEEDFYQDEDEIVVKAQPDSSGIDKTNSWVGNATVASPTGDDKTIHLPQADMSLFLNDETEVGTSENDQAVGPWEQVTLSLPAQPGSLNQTNIGEPAKTSQLTSTYMILVDLDENRIVAERSGETKMYPASMTKVLTAITARDYITEEKLADTFPVTQEIVDATKAEGMNAVGFKGGDIVTVRDLLYGTMVCSGGDAAMSLSEYCARTKEDFAVVMNQRIEDMGLSATSHFTNPVGMFHEDLYTTPKDMAIIMSVAVQDSLLLDVMSKRIYVTDTPYPDINMPEGIEVSNWFLRRIEDKEMNGEVLAAKTGYVNESGFCAVSYYQSNTGKKYICVTGNSFSSWRTIYDHVSVYRSFAQ